MLVLSTDKTILTRLTLFTFEQYYLQVVFIAIFVLFSSQHLSVALILYFILQLIMTLSDNILDNT